MIVATVRLGHFFSGGIPHPWTRLARFLGRSLPQISRTPAPLLQPLSHTALARRYRPRSFSEVATQEHVSETLRRAVSGGRVGHAYLFSGPRGVGKTTLARVLAMALNCAQQSPEGEPCGTCESCTAIWSGTTSLDVVEIDAASNRGVDDARDLRSRAMYAPSEEGRFKVYIVDEAHMLTREAWNALLKVLEEPPPRVIFIFATTEPEKIEQTAAPIMSRCQRFDFRRVGVAEIVQRLQVVLDREDSAADAEALRLIARKADGGMRDALSLADQVLALSQGGGISVETVRRILGVVAEERFLHTFDLVARRDQGGVFALIQDLLDGGYDLVEFYQGLLDALRTLLRLRVGAPVPELTGESLAEWQGRAALFEASDLVRMLGMASDLETRGGMRRAAQPRILLELLLIRFTLLDRTVELESLFRALGGEVPPAPVTPRTPSPLPVEPPDPGSASSPSPTIGGRPPAPSAESNSSRSSGPAPSSGTPPAMPTGEAAPSPATSTSSGSTQGAPLLSEPAARPPAPTPAPGAPSSPAPPAQDPTLQAPSSPAPPAQDPAPRAASGPAPSAPAPDTTAQGDGGPRDVPAATGRIRDAWTELLDARGEGLPPGMSPLLRGAEIQIPKDGKLIIGLPVGLDLERLHGPSIRRLLEDAMGRFASGMVRVDFRELAEPQETKPARISQGQVREGLLEDLLEKEPGLKGAVESWDLDIVD